MLRNSYLARCHLRHGHRAEARVRCIVGPHLLERSSRLYLYVDRLRFPSLLYSNTRLFSAVPEALLPASESKVKEQYSRKTPLEHVLLRPGMYIGSVQKLPPSECWVLDPTPPAPSDTSTETVPNFRMVRKEYGLVPALIKVFDEIIVNASDNRLRDPDGCTRIDVMIDPGDTTRAPFISVRNNGKGIPVEIHQEENIYLPNLLFGHLLTGSNFDDTQKRLTGGRHGYGAKLTNIFSREFTVETQDEEKGLCYRQTWKNNMSESTEPVVTSKDGKDYTTISFVPDMPRLTGIPGKVQIDPEDYALMCRRVVDVAGCGSGKLIVTLNGKDVSMPTFEAYSNLYRKEGSLPLVYAKVNSRWEIAIGLSDKGSFDGISFVNGMATSRGGTHINEIVKQVTKIIHGKAIKGNSEFKEAITSAVIKRNLFVSCNAFIENPSFDSQMKESLTSHPSSWGSNCTLETKILNKIVATVEDGGPGIVEEVLKLAVGRQYAHLVNEVGGTKKTKQQLLSIEKLEDAHLAGTNRGVGCTLILTEGDSAKALAVAGLEVIGRKTFGVFPLQGKFLNVRHATVQKMTHNAEVKALCSILGLDFKKSYETSAERAQLRYGHVMLMTDQDTDGSHIKGLVMNFFRYFWPKLLLPSTDEPHGRTFLSSFITPLLKVKRKGTAETLAFYSMAEYKEWRSSLGNEAEIKKWNVKYYKGLGTSTPAEAKEYFSAFKDHVRPFSWKSEVDGELLDMLFDKARASDRRAWILNDYNEELFVVPDASTNSVTYQDFVNHEMIHYSNADNFRSLPSAIDGLKPSQRKVLFACFKRKLNAEIKVAQLAGYCAEHTAYHHGEASLQNTIVGMAQDFVGSNNINLLVPSGQFGTRLTGGSDAASARYIFTRLSPVTRCLFPEEDDALLKYREDDGQLIEPEFFCPIIPLLLVNGATGIGTGWSTSIPMHNPRDVIEFVRAKLDSLNELPPIHPWAKGFTGEILRNENSCGYTSFGVVTPIDSRTVKISELPLGTWTSGYKTLLLKLRDKGDILSFFEDHTTVNVSFAITLQPEKLEKMMLKGLHKAFKLKSSINTTNMNAFNASNVIQKFDSAESIAEAHFLVRQSLYHDRKSVLTSEMKYKATMMRNKARFIAAVADGDIELVGTPRKTRAETIAKLQELEFDDKSQLEEIRNKNAVAARWRVQSTVGEEDEQETDVDFDYLLNLPLSSLTSEKVDALYKDAEDRESELAILHKTSPEDLWRSDLDKLELHL